MEAIIIAFPSLFAILFIAKRDGVIISSPQKSETFILSSDKIFDFIEAIVTKKDSWSMLDTINETDMAIPIIYNLFNTAKEILQVQSCKVDISNRTGINPYKLKHVQRKCGYYTNSQLKEIMRLCLNVDVGIKGGDIPGHIALRYLLINLNKIA